MRVIMEAKELMIGDWVYYGYDTIIPTKYIIEYAHYIEELNSCFSPIPLTAEILELNDYIESNEDADYTHKWYDVTIQIFGGANDCNLIMETKNGNMEIYIKYVHELQHALRLCGLNELADNFKVE